MTEQTHPPRTAQAPQPHEPAVLAPLAEQMHQRLHPERAIALDSCPDCEPAEFTALAEIAAAYFARLPLVRTGSGVASHMLLGVAVLAILVNVIALWWVLA